MLGLSHQENPARLARLQLRDSTDPSETPRRTSALASAQMWCPDEKITGVEDGKAELKAHAGAQAHGSSCSDVRAWEASHETMMDLAPFIQDIFHCSCQCSIPD